MGADAGADVDILIVGAGVTGIYQLYRAREAGYSAQMVEAGSGVGGTWYWPSSTCAVTCGSAPGSPTTPACGRRPRWTSRPA